MSTRVRQASAKAPRAVIAEESTTHISPETVSRLKAACVDEPSAVHAAEVNDAFGTVCELGSGTTGTVFLAVDRRSEGGDKFVAVKRFLPALTDDELFADQFITDMRLASSIDHPNVAKVRDFGKAGSSYYTAMEFLTGESLDAALSSPGLRKQAARPPRLLARLMANLGHGLHTLHMAAAADGASEAIHGDVTPRNLFVLFDGGVRVTDFGMVWARDTLRRNVEPGESLDHSYLAPEQLERAELDARVDVWALGVVLWELLAGQKLFRCPTAREAAVQITARRIPPPSELNSQVNAELDRIVLKALTRNRNKRYASMLGLVNDLEHYLDETGSALRQTEIAAWVAGLFPTGNDRDRGLIEMANVAASRLPDVEDAELDLAPASSAFLPADQDEPEQTTHIFAGSIKNTMRSAEDLPGAPPGEITVSYKRVPITVRRPRRTPRRSRFRAAIVPFLATVSVGLLGLGVAKALLPQRSAPSARLHSTATTTSIAVTTAAALAPNPQALPAAPSAAHASPVEIAALHASEPEPALEPDTAKPAITSDSAKPDVAPDTVKPALTPASAKEAVSKPRASATSSAAPTPASAAVKNVTGQTGQVFLTTPGGGDVFDKGRFLGRAPGGFELSPGWHTLVIKSGADNRTATVQIRANSSVMVSVPASVSNP